MNGDGNVPFHLTRDATRGGVNAGGLYPGRGDGNVPFQLNRAG